VLTNTGAGGFALASTPTLAGNPQRVVAADFNKDGRQELAVGYSTHGGFLTQRYTNSLVLLTNNGSGSFGLMTGAVFTVESGSTNVLLLSTGLVASAELVAGDVNGDTWPDLAVVRLQSGFGGDQYLLTVLTNNRQGRFVLETSLYPGGRPAGQPLAADFNGDGVPDLIYPSVSGSRLYIYTNAGVSGFASAGYVSGGGSQVALATADLNGDGWPDLVSAHGSLTVLTNDGRAAFGIWASPPSGGTANGVVAFAGGVYPPIVTANSGANTLSVLRSDQLLDISFSGNGAGLYGIAASSLSGTGSGGGLDADLLDGEHASAFAPSSNYVARSGDTMTGTLNLPANGLVAGSSQLVLSGGNVGIGTTVPQTALDVAGVIRSASGGFKFPDGTVQTSAAIGTGSNGWQLAGNAGTTPGSFVGTTDNRALELRVYGGWPFGGLRLEPSAQTLSDSINVVGGSAANSATAGIQGATIAGGGFVHFSLGGQSSPHPNTVTADFGTVGGGYDNSASGGSAVIGGGWHNAASGDSATISGGSDNAASGAYAVIGGGLDNKANADNGTVGGGETNVISSGAHHSSIGGGANNNIVYGQYAVIGGGADNQVNAAQSVIGGGENNTIGPGIEQPAPDHDHSTISGGENNGVYADHSTIGGGHNNEIDPGAYQSTIGGGAYNTIQAGAAYSVIPGGNQNTVGGPHAFAAGFQARAMHGGAFVWADWSGGSPFESSANDQFLIRAAGGVGINTNNPQVALHVNGTARVCVLQIMGGCDVAEPFEMAGKNIPKGAVVIIDEENPGRLKLSERAYDKRVAGIVSGANGINPGLTLSQQQLGEGGQNVALSGRVYVLADASNGPIKPGDLLTTSSVPGHAMKVGEYTRAQGAILGKAMGGLKEGKGMVLVLVSLQ
jgi:hypothetical protein